MEFQREGFITRWRRDNFTIRVDYDDHIGSEDELFRAKMLDAMSKRQKIKEEVDCRRILGS